MRCLFDWSTGITETEKFARPAALPPQTDACACAKRSSSGPRPVGPTHNDLSVTERTAASRMPRYNIGIIGVII